MNIKIMSIVVVALMLSACSSIVSSSQYAVTINSHPDGAKFVVTNRMGIKVHSGVTPASVTLKASSGYFEGERYTVTFKKEGYSKKSFTLTSSVDGWYWGNILFGGIIGLLIVDPATGAMYNLPDRVDISMDEQNASRSPAKDLTVTTIDSLSDEQLARLVLIQ